MSPPDSQLSTTYFDIVDYSNISMINADNKDSNGLRVFSMEWNPMKWRAFFLKGINLMNVAFNPGINYGTMYRPNINKPIKKLANN